MDTPTTPKPRHVGVFERMANFLLSRTPGFRHRYQNWGKAKKIFIAFLLYLILLPIIPIVIALIMYIHDPKGFRKSKAFPILSAIILAQLGAFGYIATRPATTSESESTRALTGKTNTVTETGKTTAGRTGKNGKHVPGNPTRGRYFENCSAAFKVGVKNIPKGDKSYRPKLDRDKDGIACER